MSLQRLRMNYCGPIYCTFAIKLIRLVCLRINDCCVRRSRISVFGNCPRQVSAKMKSCYLPNDVRGTMMRYVHFAGQSLPLRVQSTLTTTLTSCMSLILLLQVRLSLCICTDCCQISASVHMLAGTAFNVRQLCIVLSCVVKIYFCRLFDMRLSCT